MWPSSSAGREGRCRNPASTVLTAPQRDMGVGTCLRESSNAQTSQRWVLAGGSGRAPSPEPALAWIPGKHWGEAGWRSCHVGTITSTLLCHERQSVVYSVLGNGMNIDLFPGEPSVCVSPDWTLPPRRNPVSATTAPPLLSPSVASARPGRQTSKPTQGQLPGMFGAVCPGPAGEKGELGHEGPCRHGGSLVAASGIAGGAASGCN